MATSTTDLDINDLFSLELKYDNPNAALAPSGTTVTPQYGGNISQVVWQVKGREKQAYTLKYDSENRTYKLAVKYLFKRAFFRVLTSIKKIGDVERFAFNTVV